METLSTELQKMLAHCPAGVLTLARDGTISWANQSLSEMLGIDLTGSSSAQPPREDLAPLFSDQELLTVADGQGNTRVLKHTRVDAAAADLASIHYFTDYTDCAQLQQEYDRLNQEICSLQLQDPETGLLTQRAVMLVLDPQVSLSRRYQNPLTLAVMQVYWAEEPNNRRIREILKEQLRWADLIGHMGDSRFVIILPETSSADAHAIIDKVDRQILATPAVAGLNVGVTAFNKTDTASALLERAEAALDEAQMSGRTYLCSA